MCLQWRGMKSILFGMLEGQWEDNRENAAETIMFTITLAFTHRYRERTLKNNFSVSLLSGLLIHSQETMSTWLLEVSVDWRRESKGGTFSWLVGARYTHRPTINVRRENLQIHQQTFFWTSNLVLLLLDLAWFPCNHQ